MDDSAGAWPTTRRATRGTILAFGENPWNEYWQTRQHILSRLPELGWRVGYTTGVVSRWDIGKTPWLDAPWLSRARLLDGVTVLEAGRIEAQTNFWPALDLHLLNLFAHRFERCVRGSESGPLIAYFFGHRFLPYLAALPPCKVVFHADDNAPAMNGWTAAQTPQRAALIARADRIFATTSGVVDSLGPEAIGKTVLLPNGGDAESFDAGRLVPCPADLAAIPRPRIAYVGSLNDKVDFALIDRMATARSDWHWVLVGKTWPAERLRPEARAPLQRCLAHANVHFLGTKPYWELPAYCAHVDVNTMVYRTDGDGWWRDIYPLKLHEYLAAGPAVVSSDVPAIRPFGDVVSICDSDQAWLDGIANAVAENGKSALRRLSIARANTWDQRVQHVDRTLRVLLRSKAGRASCPSMRHQP